MTDAPRSPITGRPLRRDVRPMTLSYQGRTLQVDMPGWYGEDEGDSLHSREDLRVSDRALNRLKAEAMGLALPEDIRRIRKRLGVSQIEAGELIGGGPRAFQKYEAGDLLPSRAISSALALLDEHPEGLETLRRRRTM
jgi:HTH-type transcriptional regulator/antitoxin MqsA